MLSAEFIGDVQLGYQQLQKGLGSFIYTEPSTQLNVLLFRYFDEQRPVIEIMDGNDRIQEAGSLYRVVLEFLGDVAQ